MHRRLWLAWLIALSLTLCAGAAAGQTVLRPFVGVTHTIRADSAPRQLNMHIVSIDLTAPGIRVVVTPPGGPRETVRQTTLQFLEESRAQVAVNAHFFLPFPSANPFASLIGLAASNGVVYSAFEAPEQSYAIVARAPAINIDRRNRAAIVHARGGRSDTSVAERTTLWNVVSGSAQIVTNGVKTIPAYGGPHEDAALSAGGPGDYSNSRSWYDQLNARTAIALANRQRTLILFTVDRASGSLGMSVGEVADLLIRDYKVEQALNLDGGGSTTLTMEDPATRRRRIVNVPSENPDGRPVGSSLAVFASAR
jgi:exopolysaccharide biosynthesis protein